MSSDRELTAAKAGGISLAQMIRAPFLFSLLCMLCAFYVSLHGISWGMGSFRSLVLEIADTKARVVVQPGIFNQDLFGKTLYAKRVDTASGKLEQVLFEDKTSDGQSVITFIAPKGVIFTDEAKGEIQFSLEDGIIYQFDASKISIVNFKNYVAKLDLSKLLSGFEVSDIRPKEMSWGDLLAMDANQSAPSDRFQKKVIAEIHKRLALPFACVVLGFFAMPVACSFDGVRRQYGIVLGLSMFLVYYSLFSFGVSMAESGNMPPALALWLPNAVFAVAAGFGLYYSSKEQSPWMGWLRWLYFIKKPSSKV